MASMGRPAEQDALGLLGGQQLPKPSQQKPGVQRAQEVNSDTGVWPVGGKVAPLPTLEHLAEFLKQLAKDEAVYNDYFAWKQKWEVKELGWKYSLCKICTVYDNLTQPKVYSDLHAWATAGST